MAIWGNEGKKGGGQLWVVTMRQSWATLFNLKIV